MDDNAWRDIIASLSAEIGEVIAKLDAILAILGDDPYSEEEDD